MSDLHHLNSSPAAASHSPEELLTIGAGIDFADPNSPLAPYYLRPVHVAVVALLGVLFLLLNHVPLWHTDIWGHLKFGEWMLAHGSLPDGDPFCPFAAADTTALHYSWMSQCFVQLVFQAGSALAGGDSVRQLAGGVDALRLVLALLVLLRFGLLLAAYRRVSGSLPLALAAVVVLAVLSAGSMAVLRPQVLGEVCFAGVLFALSAPLLSRRGVVGLVLLFCLWANLHSSFAVGLLLLGLLLLGRVAEAAWNANPRWGNPLTDTEVRRLFLTLGLSVAAVALTNPAGPWIFFNTWQMGSHPNVLAMDEWQPLALQLGGGGHWAYYATLALVLGAALWQRRCYSATVLLVLLVFGLQPLRHQRLILWWLMLAPWAALTLTKRCEPLAPPADFPSWRVPNFRTTLIAALLVVVTLLWSIPAQDFLAGKPTPLSQSVSAATPLQVAAELRAKPGTAEAGLPALRAILDRHYPQGRFTGTVFASETLGDFFYWSLGNDPAVFIYTHVHLFSPDHWEACRTVRFGLPAWQQVLDRNCINLIVVEADYHPRLRELLHQQANWDVVLDETGSPKKLSARGRILVAVRRTPLLNSRS